MIHTCSLPQLVNIHYNYLYNNVNKYNVLFKFIDKIKYFTIKYVHLLGWNSNFTNSNSPYLFEFSNFLKCYHDYVIFITSGTLNWYKILWFYNFLVLFLNYKFFKKKKKCKLLWMPILNMILIKQYIGMSFQIS